MLKLDFGVGVVADELDPQQSLVRAWVQFEGGGEWFRLDELPEPVHQASAYDIREFVEKWRSLAERLGAHFDGGDVLDYAREIEEEG